MQTYQDLNNYGNTPVNYGTWQDYTIVFGNNAGNLSTTEYENGSFPLYKRTPLTTFSDVSRDLLINLTFSNTASLSTVSYQGDNANLSVVSSAGNSYTVVGVRTVSDYDEAFANTFVTTKNNSLVGFNMTTTVDDQFGNTRTWTANVSLIANPGFTITSPLTYNEDQYANITGVTVNDVGGNATQQYTMTATMRFSTQGDVSYSGGAFADSVSFTGTQSQITSSFSGNTWRYRPPADFVDNLTIFLNLRRLSDDRQWTRSQIFNIGNTHGEYSVPGNITIVEDTPANVANIYITDTRPDNIDANIQYAAILTSDTSNVVLSYANVTANTVTVTGTKSLVNSIIGNATAGAGNLVTISGQGDYFGSANLRYTQIQLTDGLTQASNIVIPVTVTPADEFGMVQTYLYRMTNPYVTDNVRFDYTLSDTDPLANTYSITINQTSGNTANILINGVNQGNNVTYTANRSQVVAANICSSITSTVTGNVGYNWTVAKNLTTGNTVTLASNVPVTIIRPVTQTANIFVNRGYTTNTSTKIFSESTIPARQRITISNALGPGDVRVILTSSSAYFNEGATPNANTSSSITERYYSASNNYVITGSILSVNQRLANLNFWPANTSVDSNVFCNIDIRRDSDNVSFVTGNITAAMTSRANVSNTALTTSTFNFSTLTLTTDPPTWYPSIDQILYTRGQVLLVGGGGGLSGKNYNGNICTPGGGGGLYHKANVNLFNNVFSQYTMSVGARGLSGLNQPFLNAVWTSTGGTGGNTTVTRTKDSVIMARATGGEGGTYSILTPGLGNGKAGNSGVRLINSSFPMGWGDGDMPPPGGGQLGQPLVITGGTEYWNSIGGGGGVDGAGSPAVAVPSGTGRGGPGYTSNISGSSKEYAGGGTGSNLTPRMNAAGKGADSLATSQGAEGNTTLSLARSGIIIIKTTQ